MFARGNLYTAERLTDVLALIHVLADLPQFPFSERAVQRCLSNFRTVSVFSYYFSKICHSTRGNITPGMPLICGPRPPLSRTSVTPLPPAPGLYVREATGSTMCRRSCLRTLL
jgi:hypothetical protein